MKNENPKTKQNKKNPKQTQKEPDRQMKNQTPQTNLQVTLKEMC